MVSILTGDRRFESVPLQRRVACEPDFQGHPKKEKASRPAAWASASCAKKSRRPGGAPACKVEGVDLSRAAIVRGVAASFTSAGVMNP